MIELLITLSTLFLSGITFLAYKHPHAYDKLSLPSTIFSMGITLFFAAFAWYLGINEAYKALLQFIPADKQAATLTAIENIKLSPITIVIVIVSWLLFLFYSIFLSFLPNLLKKED